MGTRKDYRSGDNFVPRRNVIHPVWRGLGCLLIVVVLALSFLAAHLLVEANAEQFEIPARLAFSVELGAWGSIRFFLLKAVVGGVLALGISLLGFLLYSLLYRWVGLGKYDSFLVTPNRGRRKG